MRYQQPTRLQMSPEAFDVWVQRPENTDRLFELIDGFVSEKNTTEVGDMVSHFDASEIAQLIGYYLRAYLMTHPIGRLSGPDGGFEVGTQRFIPDVAFIRHEHFPTDYKGGYVAVAPDLAVEVISATDREANILIKLSNYLAVNTIVWIVYPQLLQIQVHTPAKAARVLTIEDTLTGGDMLPDFSVPVQDIFKMLLPESEESAD